MAEKREQARAEPQHTLHDMTPGVDAGDLAKQPSRTSGRTRTSVDYNNLDSGKNLDYNDLALSGQKSAGKPKNTKVNQEVMKRLTDFFKKIKESSYWMQLNAAAATVANPAEFKKTLEGMDEIERGCQMHKYQNTSNLQVEFMKLLLKVSSMLGGNNDMRQKVEELTSYIEKLMENYDLKNKEIFTFLLNPLVKQGSDQLLKKPKDMDKIRKDLD